MDKMFLYNKLPVFGQNMACNLEGYRILMKRYGKEFWVLLKDYESRNGWSYDQMCEYRDMRLREMLLHCYNTVPYYTKLFNDGGIDPASIRKLEDLDVLPILTKDKIKENPDIFISSDVPKDKLVTAHTSGTTGSGFSFKTTQKAISEQWAVWWRYRRALGIEYNMTCAQFGGRVVVPAHCTKPPYYRYNKPNHMLYFSVYHMNDNNLGEYVEALRKEKVEWIHGYPSAINVLAEYMIKNNIFLDMKYVTVGSENLLDIQKEHIKSAFGVYPYEHYGLSEGVANISENLSHEMMIDEDFAAVEFVSISGSLESNIIGTNLTNYAMPLIRYQTNDVATVQVTDNGRKVLSLDGRLEDYIVLPDGTKMGRLAHIFTDMVNIQEAQVVQKSLTKIQIVIVKGANYSIEDENKLRKELTNRLIGMKFDFKYVGMIPRTKTGKLRFLVSEI